MTTILIYTIILAKVIIPVLFLVFPFQALWANYFLDVVDGDVLQQLGMTEHMYQTVDKSADLFSYICMFILGLRWPIRRLISALFIYRLIGQILFFITRDELWFFYFQNFMEPLLLVYSFFVFRKGIKQAHEYYKKHIVIIWTGVIGYKLWNEWYLHFANIDLSLLIFGFTGGK